ncbi:MAG: mechanosensitive ion channel family protein [Rhodospirillaceae bacterium]|nr:mechanosensitive ion channel family protein [Rhodospirillaceae bacterium]
MKEAMQYLDLVPDWLAGVGIFVLAAAAALLVYTVLSRALLAATKDTPSFVRSLFLRIRRLACLALILVAFNFAAQLPYFPAQFGEIVSKLLSVAVILLVGWGAVIAIDVASSFYLKRFQSEAGDSIQARKHFTQVRVLRRAIDLLIGLITIAAALMAFEPVRQFGVSLFASAGAAGLIVGLAARPVLSNLIAGIQLAVTQPIRLNDAVVVEGEWGWIEEITSTYVVIKVWDLRRLIVPLSYFMEKPFQNWTRETTQILGTVFLQVDYLVPVAQLRSKLAEIVAQSELWDKAAVDLQVTDFKESSVELRMVVSAKNSSDAWSLRCDVREKMLAFLQAEYPESLPRQRIEFSALVAHENLDSDDAQPPRIPARRNGGAS